MKPYYVAPPKTGSRTICDHLQLVGDHRIPSWIDVEYDYVFVSVRNPYERLVSAYHFMQKQDSKRQERMAKGKCKHIPKRMNDKLPREHPMRHWEFFSNNCHLPFEEFIKLWLIDNADEKENICFMPQSDWLSIDYDDMIRLESIDVDLPRVYKTITGNELDKVKHMNKTDKEPYQTYYQDPVVVELVTNFYKEDFDKLDYEILEE